MTKGQETESQGPMPGPNAVKPPAETRNLPTAALAALGIVYGDLGTSPLYTLQTVVEDAGGHLHPGTALGILSLIFWTLVITISIKYCLVVMRADNNGEGGILALMSLVGRNTTEKGMILVSCGLFGAALIYGDGIITPAISVLSALEGVNVATSAFKPYVMPAAVAILVLLFAVQPFGTARIGQIFGPVMLLWFIVIGTFGAIGVIHHPHVLVGMNPVYGIQLLLRHGWGAFIILGGVFLAITGGEAMYADMGSLGRVPIRISWYFIVLPSLLLCYAAQAGLMMDSGKIDGNPFFHIVPGWALYPMVALATVATIIASQAIITGSYSLTRQAMQLGWFPGLPIRQTSDTEYGQIYVGTVNWIMMVFTVLLTVIFGSSDKLAGAYGTAVSTTMLLTTVLLFTVMRERWHWNLAASLSVAGVFLLVDLAFFAANLLKIAEGGWIPLLFGAAIFTLMTTWHNGLMAMKARVAPLEAEGDAILARLKAGTIPRVPGTAVFLSRSAAPVSPLMVRQVQQFGALHESLVSLTVRFEQTPRVPRDQRVEISHVADNFWQIKVHFGFIEVPRLREALECAREEGCKLDLDHAVYFGANDQVVRSQNRADRLLPGWRRLLFGFMLRNAVHAVDRFALPADQFVEVGKQIAM